MSASSTSILKDVSDTQHMASNKAAVTAVMVASQVKTCSPELATMVSIVATSATDRRILPGGVFASALGITNVFGLVIKLNHVLSRLAQGEDAPNPGVIG